MKILRASDFTTDTIGFPPKSGTWDFIQQSWKECFRDTIKSNIPNYSSSVAYILYGITRSIFGGQNHFSEGAIFFNDEIYFSPVQSVANPVGPNVVIANIGITSYTDGTKADPVKYTDGNNHNVHDIRSVLFSSGISGSGNISDFDNFSQIGGWIDDGSPTIITDTGSVSLIGATIYNRYRLEGRTLIWQIKLINATVSGSPTIIGFRLPVFLRTTLKLTFGNDSGNQIGYFSDGTPTVMYCNLETVSPKVDCSIGSAFPNTTINLDMSIVCELVNQP